MKKVTRYQFENHEHTYEYLYSVAEYKMFRICNDKSRTGKFDDRCLVTRNDVQITANESQVTLEVLIVEELMTIDIKNKDVEFIDVAIGIIDILSRKDKKYV